jgi:hypothetical protein
VKLTGISHEFGTGREIYAEQEGAHVSLAIEQGATSAVLLTPSLARKLAEGLRAAAEQAEKWDES